MQVPLRLSRVESTSAADAVLLAGSHVASLAAACANFDDASMPEIFRVRDGFLLVLRKPNERPLPGIRLRRLAGEFFVPIDAVLNPALLPDELVALTRDGGLILLPHGEVLSFDSSTPLSAKEWLAPRSVRRDSWGPLPSRPDRAERLFIIERPSPPAAVIEILSGGKPEGAEPLAGAGEGEATSVPEDARPAAGSSLANLGGAAKLGVAKMLAWLGKAMKAPGLSKAGAALAKKAVEQVPRLSEKLFGEQEAALREVLRQLQSGDIEKGLRRAPIAVADPNRPSPVDTASHLGSRDPRYSLRDLIGAGGGTSSTWLGGGDVWVALANEYRRLANEASRRGDFRRAAYLYGVLLRDIRSAANVLAAGGLHRDAAILFRDKLKDLPAAAAAFERAGDFDEAVRIYEKLDSYEAAGDMLRRIGDEDRAIEYYAHAADRLAAQGRRLAAGDLMRKKGKDISQAEVHYRAGWEQSSAESLNCGERLLDQYYIAEAWPAVETLFKQAEKRLAASDAGRFFNYALKVGEDFLPAKHREEVADRVQLLFANHLRSETLRGQNALNLAGELFGTDGGWPGAVCRDAAFATRAEARRNSKKITPSMDAAVRLANGTTLGVVVARDTRDIIVATTTAVVCWRPDEDRIVPVCRVNRRQIVGLSTDPDGRIVYVMFVDGAQAYVQCFESKEMNSFQPMGRVQIEGEVPGRDSYYLQSAAVFRYGDVRLTLATSNGDRQTLSGLYLRTIPLELFDSHGSSTYLLAESGTEIWDWDHRFMRCSGIKATWCRWMVEWVAATPIGSSLTVNVLNWISNTPRVLEVVGTDRKGNLYWTQFDGHDPDDLKKQTAAVTHPDRYLAACLDGVGQVVAATAKNEIHFLSVSGATLKPRRAVRKLTIPARVVALAARTHTDSIIAILEDGSAIQLPK